MKGQGWNSQLAVVPGQRPSRDPGQHLVLRLGSFPTDCARGIEEASTGWNTTCHIEGLGDGCAGGTLCWVWTLWGWVSSWDSSAGLLMCGRVTFRFPPC